ncbi:hypothetical protein BKA80DRAFT_269942 [Phyllosticta citrichinensis]
MRLDATWTRNKCRMRDNRAVPLSLECLKCGRPGRLLARLGFLECSEALAGVGHDGLLRKSRSGFWSGDEGEVPTKLLEPKCILVVLKVVESWSNPTASRANENGAGIARQRINLAGGGVEFCGQRTFACLVGVSKRRGRVWLWNGSGAGGGRHGDINLWRPKADWDKLVFGSA